MIFVNGTGGNGETFIPEDQHFHITFREVTIECLNVIYRNVREPRVRTRTMKIIKPCNSMRAPRLRASPRHGGAVRLFTNMLVDTSAAGASLFGAAGFIANNYEE